VPEEITPDKSDDLLASRAATPSSASTAPQYSSRRELRAASEREGRAHTAPRVPKPSREAQKRIAALGAPAATPARPASASAKKKQNPFAVLTILLIVPGFLASATIPAFAFTPAGADHQAEIEQAAADATAAALPAQELEVAENIEAATVKRDVITATTEAELRAQQIAAASLASYNTSVRAAGDDYPWPSAGNTLSPLNYYYRQCVDFVAWRLNRDAGSTSAPFKFVWSNLTPSGGNASEWKRAWEAKGWKTSTTPVLGSVAWFNGNHVAYVKEIKGSNVVIEEYNGMAKLAYAIRTIPISSIPKFLYPPPR